MRGRRRSSRRATSSSCPVLRCWYRSSPRSPDRSAALNRTVFGDDRARSDTGIHGAFALRAYREWVEAAERDHAFGQQGPSPDEVHRLHMKLEPLEPLTHESDIVLWLGHR